MARREKTSPLEDWMNLIAKLPWWGGVALALASYLYLHSLATRAPSTTYKPGDITGLMFSSMTGGLATVGQFVIPAVCLLGALVSFLRRRHRQTLVANVVQSKSADALDGMTWREFELLVGEAFRLQGYQVTELGGAGPDGGVDLILVKGTEKFLVQCKQWKAFKVGVTAVRELYGVMAAKGAAGGFVVTSGRFTDDATEFAKGRNIRLIDGPILHGLIKQASNAGRTDPHAAPVQPALNVQAYRTAATPACPSCGAAMKMRTATKGASVGSRFWGCSTYPACRGTRAG